MSAVKNKFLCLMDLITNHHRNSFINSSTVDVDELMKLFLPSSTIACGAGI